VLGPALVFTTGGLILLTQTPTRGHYLTDVLPALVLLGIGGGLGFPALVGLTMSGAAPEDSGLASGILNTTQQVGGALGLAVLTSLAAISTSHRTAPGATATTAALVVGYHLALGIAAALVGCGAILALTVVTSRRPAPAVAPSAAGEPQPVSGHSTADTFDGPAD